MIALDVVDAPATVSFDGRTDSRFHLSISANEWGFFFCHRGLVSWIRVTTVVTVHDRDEHDLRGSVPPLRDLCGFLRNLQATHKIKLRREYASVRTSLPADAVAAIRDWVKTDL